MNRKWKCIIGKTTIDLFLTNWYSIGRKNKDKEYSKWL